MKVSKYHVENVVTVTPDDESTAGWFNIRSGCRGTAHFESDGATTFDGAETPCKNKGKAGEAIAIDEDVDTTNNASIFHRVGKDHVLAHYDVSLEEIWHTAHGLDFKNPSHFIRAASASLITWYL